MTNTDAKKDDKLKNIGGTLMLSIALGLLILSLIIKCNKDNKSVLEKAQTEIRSR